jgi:beta-galactosidase
MEKNGMACGKPAGRMVVLLIAFAVVVSGFCFAANGSEPAGQGRSLYHGAAYYPELWPDADIERDIAEMKRVGINVARMGEFAWSKMEPNQGEISLDYFVGVMDKLHAAGIKTFLCTPTPTPPVWLTDGHPERCYVDANGTIMVHGARQHVSYDHPEVRAACFRIVEAMAKALGKHPSLIGWQIDNEFKCHVSEDYSDASVARWHQWLETKYGTIEALNAAWGTEIWSQRYQRFDQVPAPRKTPFLHNASLSTAYRLFSREMIAAFMDEQAAIIRRHSSLPITHNMALGFSVDLERMSRNLDFVSFDDYPSSRDYPRLVADCDLFRAAKPGRAFWLMETSVSHNGWLGNHETAHPEGFLVAEAVCAYGLGSEAFCYWLWRQQRTGCELPHSAVLSAWGKPGIGYSQVIEVETARRRLEPLLTTSRPAAAQAAVTWSDRGRVFLMTEPLGANRQFRVDYESMVLQWHHRLFDSGIHRDIRFEGASLEGLKLLVTPVMPAMDAAFRDRVRAWVENGGIWICGPLVGLRTEEHTVPTNAGLGLLESLAGVETVFSYPITGTGATGLAFGIEAPLSGWCSAVRPAGKGTESLGTFKSGLTEGLSFMTERALGKGKIIFLGCQPQGKEGEQLLQQLVSRYSQQANIEMRFTVSKGTLICPRVDDQGRALWIIINMDGLGGHVDLPQDATDAFTNKPIPAGRFSLGRYEYRAVKW